MEKMINILIKLIKLIFSVLKIANLIFSRLNFLKILAKSIFSFRSKYFFYFLKSLIGQLIEKLFSFDWIFFNPFIPFFVQRL